MILSEIERILNNRPLTYQYEEIGDILTPNHLLFGRSLTAACCGEDVVVIENLSKRERHLKLIINRFWNLWKTQYLRELREYNQRKNNCKYGEVSIGDIVIIDDPKLKRIKWKIGKIAEVHRSKDDKVRTAIVDIISDTGKRGQLRRPINKLYCIEKTMSIINDETVPVTFVDEKAVPLIKV